MFFTYFSITFNEQDGFNKIIYRCLATLLGDYVKSYDYADNFRIHGAKFQEDWRYS